MRIIFGIIFFAGIMLFGCSGANQLPVAGYYESHIPRFGANIYTTGNKLSLEKDSSFTYEGCGQVASGRWRLVNDSIVLFCNKFRYKNDSLDNAMQPSCNENSIYQSFRVMGNGQLQSAFASDGKTYRNRLRRAR